MTYPKAIVISAALIAASIAFAAYQPAQSGLVDGGRYMLGDSAVEGVATWVIDTETGETRICSFITSNEGKVTQEAWCRVIQAKW